MSPASVFPERTGRIEPVPQNLHRTISGVEFFLIADSGERSLLDGLFPAPKPVYLKEL